MLSLLPHLVSLIAAVGGLILATYIYREKRKPKPLVCPMGTDCDTVVHSEFSKFLGIPLEFLGILYYGLTILLYAAYILLIPPTSSLVVFAFPLALAAFLFSAYLTFIQGVVLRQWCTWCLTSAGLSTTIFGMALLTTDFGVVSTFLLAYKPVLLAIHLIGLALGLGAATVADVMFFRFLKDLRISEFEANILRAISNIIWLGLGILAVSGTGLFLTSPAEFLHSSKFLAKLTIVSIIAINGAFLNLYITPMLVRISFGDPHPHFRGELRRERKIAFALGAISLTSWYSAFTLGFLNSLPLPVWWILAIYFALVAGAIIGSQGMEKIIARKGWTTNTSQVH